MSLAGADVDELRSAAKQLTQAADRLQGSMKSLTALISNAPMWRGADADQFRSEWKGQSVHALNSAVDRLRSGAEVLRRNADQQETASRAEGGAIGQAPNGVHHHDLGSAAKNTHDMWKKIKSSEHADHSSGYRVQRVVGDDGVTRYIVYIGGTDASDGQTILSNVPAAKGIPDATQLAAIKKLIDPPDAEVMLVGYSQGGMDAQNIAKSHELNVKQIVTFGSPTRPDLDVPAVHLRASGDPIPYSTTGAAVASLLPGGPDPYASSALETGSNNEYYSANSNVNSLNPLDHHASGYDNVSNEYDAAVGKHTAGEKGSHMSSFQGRVDGKVDIDTSGNKHGDW